MRLENCRALITGASAGIGQEFARQLAERAAIIVLVARRADRLEQLQAELTLRHPKLRVEIHRADLSRRESVDQLINWLGAEDFTIDLLINNAGVGDIGAFSTADPERIDSMLQVNMVALTRLTRAVVPSMIEARRGGILNVSSSASFLPMPNFAVYAASKAYVTSFSEALWSELHPHNVRVCALCPGPVHTEFTQVARRKPAGPLPAEPELAYVPVEQVVAEALHGLERDQPIVIPGALMKIGMLIVRLIPRPLLRMSSRFFAKPA